jgi:hypothetical protein
MREGSFIVLLPFSVDSLLLFICKQQHFISYSERNGQWVMQNLKEINTFG